MVTHWIVLEQPHLPLVICPMNPWSLIWIEPQCCLENRHWLSSVPRFSSSPKGAFPIFTTYTCSVMHSRWAYFQLQRKQKFRWKPLSCMLPNLTNSTLLCVRCCHLADLIVTPNSPCPLTSSTRKMRKLSQPPPQCWPMRHKQKSPRNLWQHFLIKGPGTANITSAPFCPTLITAWEEKAKTKKVTSSP